MGERARSASYEIRRPTVPLRRVIEATLAASRRLQHGQLCADSEHRQVIWATLPGDAQERRGWRLERLTRQSEYRRVRALVGLYQHQIERLLKDLG